MTSNCDVEHYVCDVGLGYGQARQRGLPIPQNFQLRYPEVYDQVCDLLCFGKSFLAIKSASEKLLPIGDVSSKLQAIIEQFDHL